MANSPSGDSVINRVVKILGTFDARRTEQTVSEIARRCSLPVSTTHRLVTDLLTEGLLERTETTSVRVGTRLWELAARGSRVLSLRDAAMPFMEDVQSVVHEHTQLGVLESDEVLFLERLSGRSAGANITRIAGRLPVHASSSGLVLLAFAPPEFQDRILSRPLAPHSPETVTDPLELRRLLAGIRQQRFVSAPGSIAAESTGLAVPVEDASGQVIAALSVIMPRGREAEHATVLALKMAAHGITRTLAGSTSRIPFNGKVPPGLVRRSQTGSAR